MVTLSEIESAVEALPLEEQYELSLFLTARLPRTEASAVLATSASQAISIRGHFPEPSNAQFEAEFQRLTDDWQSATKFQSSVEAICTHPSYQRIIGMGLDAVPLILRELRARPHHWSWALNAITGANPVLSDHAGKVSLMARDWIEWGIQQGFLDHER